ncbi:MAG: RNA polymerase sigma factor [Akkermansiaceae bacterium]
MTEDRDQQSALLMQALARGRDDALNALMAMWTAPLIGYLSKLTGSVATGEDLAQETLVRVYRHKLDYRPHQKFSTWLFTIATNLAKNFHRWKRRHPEQSHESGDIQALSFTSTQEDPSEVMSRCETMKALDAAMQQLPELMREALLLSTMQGLSHGQIARIQDSSDKAVELRIYRARKMLREKLADHWDTP